MLTFLFDALIAPFAGFAFMQKALVASLVLGISASPVGVFLMLRRLSLTGDAISHAILPGAAIGYLIAGLSLGAMALGGLIAGLIVALLAGGLARISLLQEDANLAVFYLLSLAIGVVLVSSQDQSLDLLHLLFGSVLALQNSTLVLLLSIAWVSLITLALVYRPLVAECLEPSFLQRHSLIASRLTHFVFLTLVVLNLVAGFQALGTLLAVGIMIFPAAIARLWANQLEGLLLVAILTAWLASWLGLLASWHFNLASGPAIILALGCLYMLSLILAKNGLIRRNFLPKKHLQP